MATVPSQATFLTRLPEVRVRLLTLICAASAGVHAVLAPSHFQEELNLGVGFAAAAAALGIVAVAIDRRPQSQSAMHAAALLLGALIVAYTLTRVAAVPLLGEHREPLDPVGVSTKLIEAVGLGLAIKPLNRRVASRQPALATEKGVLS
jgi:hypothetical protein